MDPVIGKVLLLSVVGLAGDTVVNALPESANVERLGVASVTITILIVIVVALWREFKAEREKNREKDRQFYEMLNAINGKLDSHHDKTMDAFRRGDGERYRRTPVTPLPIRNGEAE
jgi:hypothetical protein